MKKVILKGLAGIFIFIFIVLAGLYVYGLYVPEIEGYFAKREEAVIMARLEAEKVAFLELHQKDIEGGVTTEETFDLLITALKAGDINLASKYYVPIYQEEAREVLEKQLREKGDLKTAIDNFVEIRVKGKRSCSELDGELGGCYFEYTYITDKDEIVGVKGSLDKIIIPKGHRRSGGIGFWLNPYTKKWKISDQP
jgi:hypothetical protein